MSRVHYFLVLVLTVSVFLLPLAAESGQTKEVGAVYTLLEMEWTTERSF